MVQYEEFSAWIEVGGVRSEEYGVEITEDQGQKTVTCWIPSESGKTFEIHWKDDVVRTATDGQVCIDGQRYGGRIIRPGTGRNTTSKSNIRTSLNTVTSFVFSPLILTDDDAYLDNPAAQGVGEIKIKILRVAIMMLRTSKPALYPSIQTLPKEQKFHERSKKGVVHKVGFAEERPCRLGVHKYDTKRLPGGPAVVFLFRYRPIDVLRANEIAPPLRAPKREARELDEEDVIIIEDDDSEDEEAKLEARLAAVRAKRRRKEVKQEDIKPAFLPGEVIDLT